MRKHSRIISLMLLLAFINLIVGCSYHNYKVTTAEASSDLIKQLQANKKYFIIHQGSETWHMKSVALNEEKTEISGLFEELPQNHFYYLQTKGKRSYPYKPAEGYPIYEVHFYISEYAEGQDAQITIPLTSIKKIEIYDKDKVADGSASALTVVGVVFGIMLVVLIIVALTKSSCPLVYINEGASRQFVGEMYGGAIYSSLERNDYMPLPGFISTNGEYQIQITNELLERQYTNLAEVVMVGHPDDTEVIMDKNGIIQTITRPESPSEARSDGYMDHTDAVLSRDSCAYLFDDSNTSDDDVSNLNLSFKKPIHAISGKLILNAKNSYWLDYIYGKFNEQFGTYYNQHAENQKKTPKEKAIQWMLNQDIPLSVSVQTANGWEFVDYFNVMGPLASRDLVMPIDLSQVRGDNVRIKLECGFMFWEIDYAAMDFSENIPVEVTHMVPSSALDEKGNDVSSLIAAIDTKYLVQPEVGNAVTLKYAVPVTTRYNLGSFFLCSRGYYEYIRDYKGKPDFLYLYSFRQKGAFTSFAKQQYDGLTGIKNSMELVLNSDDAN